MFDAEATEAGGEEEGGKGDEEEEQDLSAGQVAAQALDEGRLRWSSFQWQVRIGDYEAGWG